MFSVHAIGYFYYTSWNVRIILEKKTKTNQKNIKLVR